MCPKHEFTLYRSLKVEHLEHVTGKLVLRIACRHVKAFHVPMNGRTRALGNIATDIICHEEILE